MQRADSTIITNLVAGVEKSHLQKFGNYKKIKEGYIFIN
jgi:hypothetical protein